MSQPATNGEAVSAAADTAVPASRDVSSAADTSVLADQDVSSAAGIAVPASRDVSSAADIAVPTIRDAVLARLGDTSVGILYEDESWTHHQYAAQCCAVAHFLLASRQPGPFHVGVLLDNGPDYSVMLGAAALCGATLVGINPTRRGQELVRDIAHTECQIIVTESCYRELLEPVEAQLGGPAGASGGLPIFEVDSAEWQQVFEPYVGQPPPEVELDPAAPYLLLFTSGTTGDPKAAICSQQRMARIAAVIAQTQNLTAADVCYQCMPMFHSNALLAGWSPCLVAGATAAFRRRFSASGWLADIRQFGATYFNYVGKPLTYILATPEQADDADNPLRRVFGNEGAPHDLDRFSTRFGVVTQDSYGSTEGGFGVSRTAATPPGALGQADEHTKIYDSDTGLECQPAMFAADGSLSNPDEAIGEIVHLKAVREFEGYWNNPEADHERIHDGIYWSGDLGYKDADGLIYFAGRNYDWLRVDGENFAAAPLERILVRHEDVDLAAVYAVPNSDVGDDVMAAVVHRPGAVFKPAEFYGFLASQKDLGTKWLPKYVRWADDLPKTQTMKILKRVLRNERWECQDEVWLKDGQTFRRLLPQDAEAIRAAFAARERAHLL